MAYASTFLLLVFITNCTYIALMDMAYQYFALEKSTGLSSDFVTVKSLSLMECGIACSNSFCRAVSFNELTTECRIEVDLSMDVTTVYEEKTILIRLNERWHLFNGGYYYVGLTKKNWTDAQTDCNEKGSNLVKINDNDEQQWLSSLMQMYFERNDFIKKFKQVWIGGSDLVNEGEWVWISDNTAFMFKAWLSTQPDNYDNQEHCASVLRDNDFLWNDGPCFYRIPYICKK